jgi:hypothetical protein
VIGGGELKIDPAKKDVVIKWPVPTNFTDFFRRFVGVAQYLWKFIVYFSIVVTLLCTIIVSGNIFQWVKNQYKYFDELK